MTSRLGSFAMILLLRNTLWRPVKILLYLWSGHDVIYQSLIPKPKTLDE